MQTAFAPPSNLSMRRIHVVCESAGFSASYDAPTNSTSPNTEEYEEARRKSMSDLDKTYAMVEEAGSQPVQVDSAAETTLTVLWTAPMLSAQRTSSFDPDQVPERHIFAHSTQQKKHIGIDHMQSAKHNKLYLYVQECCQDGFHSKTSCLASASATVLGLCLTNSHLGQKETPAIKLEKKKRKRRRKRRKKTKTMRFERGYDFFFE